MPRRKKVSNLVMISNLVRFQSDGAASMAVKGLTAKRASIFDMEMRFSAYYIIIGKGFKKLVMQFTANL